MIATIQAPAKDGSGKLHYIEFQAEVTHRFIHHKPRADSNYGFFEHEGKFFEVREFRGKWQPILRNPVNESEIEAFINNYHGNWEWYQDDQSIEDEDPWLWYLLQTE